MKNMVSHERGLSTRTSRFLATRESMSGVSGGGTCPTTVSGESALITAYTDSLNHSYVLLTLDI